MGADMERAKAVDLAITQIERQFGKGAIMRLGGADCPLPYNPDLEKAAVPQVPDIVAVVQRMLAGRA